MRKLSFVFVLFMVGLVGNSYAQLPNNPANPHGIILQNSMALAKWEQAGDSLYYEFTITTPATFYDENSLPSTVGDFEPFIQFNANGHDWQGNFPGSMYITYTSANYPYGTQTYTGVIDITGWDEWTTIQANYYLYTGNPDNPVLEDVGLIDYTVLE